MPWTREMCITSRSSDYDVDVESYFKVSGTSQEDVSAKTNAAITEIQNAVKWCVEHEAPISETAQDIVDLLSVACIDDTFYM